MSSLNRVLHFKPHSALNGRRRGASLWPAACPKRGRASLAFPVFGNPALPARVSGAPLVALATGPSRAHNHRAVSDLNPLA